jgi:hypothetical protein
LEGERNKKSEFEEWYRYNRSGSEERHSQHHSHPIPFSLQNSKHFGYPSTMCYNERNNSNRDYSIHFYRDLSVPISYDPRRRLSSYYLPSFNRSFPPSSQFFSRTDSRENFNSSSTRGSHENSDFSFSNASVQQYHNLPEYSSSSRSHNQSNVHSKFHNFQSFSQQHSKQQKDQIDIQDNKIQSEDEAQQVQRESPSKRGKSDLIDLKGFPTSNRLGDDKRNHFEENPPSDIIDLTVASNQSAHFSIDRVLSKIPISPTLAGYNLFEVIIKLRNQNYEDYFDVNRNTDIYHHLSSNRSVKVPHMIKSELVTQNSLIFESPHKRETKSFESSEGDATNDVSVDVNLYDDLGLTSTKETNLNEFTIQQGLEQYKNILVSEFTLKVF